MATIGMNDLKTGLTIEYNQSIWRVLEFQHVKPGKGAAFVRSKLKNLRTGAVNEITFRPGDKFETANIETTEMQYLYAEGDQHVFMDNETYEQVSIPDDKIQDALKFLLENMNVKITTYEGEILDVELPKTVELTVKETQPGIKELLLTVVVSLQRWKLDWLSLFLTSSTKVTSWLLTLTTVDHTRHVPSFYK